MPSNQTNKLEKILALQAAILNDAAHTIIATDLDGVITVFNPAAEKMLGYSADEVVGVKTPAIFHDHEEVASRASEFQHELNIPLEPGFDVFVVRSRLGLSNQYEWTYIRKDGSRVPVLLSITCLLEGGKITGYLGISVDITDRKQIEKALYISREQLNEAQRLAKVGSWSLDLVNNHLEWSDEIFRLFEIDKEKFGASYESFLEAIHPDDREKVNAAYVESLKNRKPYEISHRLLFDDGRVKYVHESCETLFSEEGEALLSRGTVQDITAIKKAEKTIELYATVFQHSAIAMLITNAENKIVATNPALSELTGYSEEELLGHDPSLLASGMTPRETYQDMWGSLKKQGHWQGELHDRRKNGEAYPKWISISAIHDELENVTNYVASFTDITERKMAEDRISYLAHHDPLTGLHNRFSLEQRLGQSISEARRSETHLAVMFIDMDRFKIINDTLGHEVGDKLLIEVAKRLRESVRDSDIVTRIGGDEFVIVLTAINDINVAAHVADKIIKALGDVYLVDNNELHSSPSIGISFYPQDGDDRVTLLKNADAAMYHAKELGRNNYQFFTEQLNDAARERMELERDLREAVESKQFVLMYQPKVDAKNNKIVGVEALIRWEHPVRGTISPMSFIPVAEECGLMDSLGEWILDEACRQLKEWREIGLKQHIAVNVSAKQLENKVFPEIIRDILGKYQVKPGELEIEVTESVAMLCPEASIAALGTIRKLDVAIAIDDFGTGYSSLAYLKLLPVQYLKIDRTFVRDIESDENDASICQATISLAHSLGLKVIAEGVETTTQCDVLKNLNCDLLQGYFFGKPVPAEEITARLTSMLS